MQPSPDHPSDGADRAPDAAPRQRPPSAIDLGRGAWVAPGDARYAFSRSSGPGGQNVNKVNTRAELRVTVSDIGGLDDAALARLRQFAGSRLNRQDEIVIASDASRSQLANRLACLDRLVELVTRAATPPPVRKKTKPTYGSKMRRLDAKRRQSRKKSDRGWRDEG